MQKRWTAGKVVAVVLGSIGAGIILLVSLYISIIQISANILFFDSTLSDDPYEAAGERTEGQPTERYEDDRGKDAPKEDSQPKDDLQGSDEENADSQYYDFHNEIKANLSYHVRVDEFDQTIETNEHVQMRGNFPVVTCEDKKKEEWINAAIQEEMQVVSEHVTYMAKELPEDVSFIFEMESYVTYMDEDILSVIYEEYAYLGDEMYESYIVSINLDMESGMQMTNSQILNIDDEFSIDFRKRNEKQNGQVQGLDYYSDQDITEMLNDDDYLIIFYTPLGMEVGINYYYGWVTVTYTDYAKFSNPF